MKFVNRYKGQIAIMVCIVTVLAIAFFCGDNKQGSVTKEFANQETFVSVVESIQEKTYQADTEYLEDKGVGRDEHNNQLVSSSTPVEIEPEETKALNDQLTCILSIRCDNAVGKISEKADAIPKDGVIFSEQTVVFYEGESVFNVLMRELKKNKIHLEFVNVPIYNSAYIEGIANLYEFDCGELSGWMYKVNDWFPNYGCSRYQLKAGDKIEWVYTCDLGKDVGGHYSARNGN